MYPTTTYHDLPRVIQDERVRRSDNRRQGCTASR
jgi:hypothetical protein